MKRVRLKKREKMISQGFVLNDRIKFFILCAHRQRLGKSE